MKDVRSLISENGETIDAAGTTEDKSKFSSKQLPDIPPLQAQQANMNYLVSHIEPKKHSDNVKIQVAENSKNDLAGSVITSILS